METTDLIWMNGSLKPWKDTTTHVLSHALHYGSAVFEGIRCYKTPKGPAIFRLGEHIDRLLYSASVIKMSIPFDRAQLMEACRATVRENKVEACYIRPLAYYGYGKMGLNPIGATVDCMIACWPWGKYLGGDTVRIRTSQYIRIHPKSLVADAKISGHYVNSILASLEVSGDERYDESLFLDYEGNVAEGPGENIFLAKDGQLITPKKGAILPGITRDSIMAIAKDMGISITERTVKPEELKTADECFFTGTAAEVTGIVSVDDQPIASGEMGPITRKLKTVFDAAVRGEDARYERWLTYVG